MTMTYDKDQAERAIHDYEQEGWNRHGLMPVGLVAGRYYTDDEVHRTMVAYGWKLSNIPTRHDNRTREQLQHAMTRECARIVDIMLRRGVLVRNADGTLSRVISGTTSWVNVTDDDGKGRHMIGVPVQEAQAIIDAERIKLHANLPDVRRDREIAALKAQLERLESQ